MLTYIYTHRHRHMYTCEHAYAFWCLYIDMRCGIKCITFGCIIMSQTEHNLKPNSLLYHLYIIPCHK